MVAIKDIASVVYGCILGNWMNTVMKTLSHRPGGEHRFVVLAQTSEGYIRVLETDSESAALDFENRIDEDTNVATGYIYDRLYPADKDELQVLDIHDNVPAEVEDRDQLLAIMHEARKYW